MQQQIATPAPAGSPRQDASLSQWEAVTRHAISTPRDISKDQVLPDYEQALSIARLLIDAPPPDRAEDCVVALIVSYHNLADLYADDGDIDVAARHRSLAHETLIALMLDNDRDATLRQAALRHSRETHLALLSHVSRHGEHTLITHALRMGCMALNVGSLTQH